jgi:hypothetical protein
MTGVSLMPKSVRLTIILSEDMKRQINSALNPTMLENIQDFCRSAIRAELDQRAKSPTFYAVPTHVSPSGPPTTPMSVSPPLDTSIPGFLKRNPAEKDLAAKRVAQLEWNKRHDAYMRGETDELPGDYPE